MFIIEESEGKMRPVQHLNKLRISNGHIFIDDVELTLVSSLSIFMSAECPTPTLKIDMDLDPELLIENSGNNAGSNRYHNL